ncbi:hypothetical protein FRX31_005665 [Thalictrum thalictroides]|uniref:Uncharacterized protein n=1 Tax=Thalictrum thalictroides TaxID=46969 RepID=A0A7J6X4U5_THATH|nr:hypothetical protein FRX31_005665 [Thalictrum thalictroides]
MSTSIIRLPIASHKKYASATTCQSHSRVHPLQYLPVTPSIRPNNFSLNHFGRTNSVLQSRKKILTEFKALNDDNKQDDSLPEPTFFSWVKQICQTIIPYSQSKLEEFLGLLGQADVVVNAVEIFLKGVDGVLDTISEMLPDGSTLKKIIAKVDDITEKAVDDVELVDEFLDKVDQQLETFIQETDEPLETSEDENST